MILPDRALEEIAAVIQGRPLPGTTEPVSGRFSIARISQFFGHFGGDGLFPRADSPDAALYVVTFLQEVNTTVTLDQLICALPDFCSSHEYRDDHPNTIAYEINKILKPYGFRMKQQTAAFTGFSSPTFGVESLAEPLLEHFRVALNQQL
jgi:hypothetical protein